MLDALRKCDRFRAMPKEMEQALEHEATKKHLTGDRRNAYIYGTMRKEGWKPERELHDKMAHIDRKHTPKD